MHHFLLLLPVITSDLQTTEVSYKLIRAPLRFDRGLSVGNYRRCFLHRNRCIPFDSGSPVAFDLGALNVQTPSGSLLLECNAIAVYAATILGCCL